jgi:nucleoside 2-deoxyribosyltransferase
VPPKVYIASPLGFTAAGRLYSESVLLPAVRAAGLEPLDPWNVAPEILRVFELDRDDPVRKELLGETNRIVGGRNAEMIRSADGVLAVLDGDDVDSGTAAEIGYAAAVACPIVGLRTDLRVSGDNEATLVNLQVEWFIFESGGLLTTNLDDAVAGIAAAVAHNHAVRDGDDGYVDPSSGLFVFTAAYLSARGTCCDSNCRHCPYKTPAREQE